MFRNILLSVVILGLLILTSCATVTSGTEPAEVIAQPAIPHETDGVDIKAGDPASNASLWSDLSSREFFQDLRAYKVGDLVTVNIVETSKASKAASTQTGRESSIDAGIDNVMGWEGRLKNLTSFGKSDVKSAYDNSSMLKGSFSSDFNGTAATSRDDSMTASITARVIEVKPNGNLLIKGTREVRVNNETQIIILSGLIRPMDISPDNTVLSSYIGDARIEYIGRGAISDKQRPGWLAKTMDFVWPF